MDPTLATAPSAAEQRKAVMETKIRRRVALEEKAFRLVERLLDNPTSGDFLLQASKYLERSHYADVVEERSIAGLCGYPVCEKPLGKVPNQKYHISLKDKKVYDITERKKFCSDKCFHASQCFVAQISTTAVWMRDEEEEEDDLQPVTLLDPHSDIGSAGEEVILSPSQQLQREIRTLEEPHGNHGNGENHGNHKHDEFTALDNLANNLSKVYLQSQPSPAGGQEVTGSGSQGQEVTGSGSQDQEVTGSASQGQEVTSCDFQGQEVSESTTCGENREVTENGQGHPSQGQGQHILMDDADPLSDPQQVPSVEEAISDDELGIRQETTSCKYAQENVSATVTRRLQERLAEKKLMYYVPESDQGDATTREVVNASVKKHNVMSKGTETVPGSTSSQDSKDSAMMSAQDKGKMLMDLLDKRKKLQDQISSVEVEQRLVSRDIGSTSGSSKEVNTDSGPEKGHFGQFAEDVGPKRKDPPQARPVKTVKSTRGITSADVLKNIQRVAEQQQGSGHGEPVPAKKKETVPKVTQTPLDLMQTTLLEWFTGDSLRLLLGGGNQDNTSEDFAAKYAALGRRVDEQEMEDGDLRTKGNAPTKQLPDMEKLRKESAGFELRIQEFYQGKMTEPERKGASGGKAEAKKSDRVVVRPHVDSRSQLAVRRKIVLDKLNKVLPSLLLPLKLNVSQISSHLRHLVYTFNLGSHNINLKPAEWTLMGYFLLKLLSPRLPDVSQALKEEYAVHFFRTLTLSIGISDSEVQNVLDTVLQLPV